MRSCKARHPFFTFDCGANSKNLARDNRCRPYRRFVLLKCWILLETGLEMILISMGFAAGFVGT